VGASNPGVINGDDQVSFYATAPDTVPDRDGGAGTVAAVGRPPGLASAAGDGRRRSKAIAFSTAEQSCKQ